MVKLSISCDPCNASLREALAEQFSPDFTVLLHEKESEAEWQLSHGVYCPCGGLHADSGRRDCRGQRDE